MLGGLVADHLDLLDDHSLFPFHFLRIDAGVAIHVGENLCHPRKMIRRSRRVEAGALLGGVGIEVATHSLDFLTDPAGASLFCSLKEEMLQKMGDPPDPQSLVASTDGTPDPDGDRLG